MGNPFVHVELMSNDVDKAKTFFGELFDWKLDDMPMGDMTYTMIRVGEGTGGGMMKNPLPGGPSMWVAYVLVDDLKAAADKLCQAKGLKEGKSLSTDSVEACSAKVLIPGRARKPDDCRTDNFVTRALCQ